MLIPARKSVDILMKWITKKLCKHFVWTLKFTGKLDYQPVLQMVRDRLGSTGCHFVTRHLPSHGNEIVVVGSVSKVGKASQINLNF